MGLIWGRLHWVDLGSTKVLRLIQDDLLDGRIWRKRILGQSIGACQFVVFHKLLDICDYIFTDLPCLYNASAIGTLFARQLLDTVIGNLI